MSDSAVASATFCLFKSQIVGNGNVNNNLPSCNESIMHNATVRSSVPPFFLPLRSV